MQAECRSVGVFQRSELRIQVSQCSVELFFVTRVAARLQIFLHARPRKQQHFPAPARFQLSWCQLPLFPSTVSFLKFLHLAFHGLAFPSSCHPAILC